MSRNIAPVTVLITSSCGVRTNLRAVRAATAPAVASGPAGRWAGTSARSSVRVMSVSVMVVIAVVLRPRSRGVGGLQPPLVGLVGLPGVLDRDAGQGQEHLVERRAAQADVVDLDRHP